MTGEPAIATVFGVDFSGARLAGKNTWVARFDVESARLRLRLLGSFDGDAIALGRRLVDRSRALAGAMHVRRVTDREEKTPFDAVPAGVGAFAAWRRGDWRERALREPRIAREGWVFA